MKKIITINLLLIGIYISLFSINGFTQVVIPKNDDNKIRYNSDYSITFEHGKKFSVSQIPQLLKIFEIADKWADFCKDSSKIDVEKLITVTSDYKFIFVYENDIGCYRKSIIEIRGIKDNSYLDSEITRDCHNRFVYYLTIYRDAYYNNIKVHNDYVDKINNKLDSLNDLNGYTKRKF